MCPNSVTHEDLPQAHSLFHTSFSPGMFESEQPQNNYYYCLWSTRHNSVTTGMSFPVWCLSLSPGIIEIALKLKRV